MKCYPNLDENQIAFEDAYAALCEHLKTFMTQHQGVMVREGKTAGLHAKRYRFSGGQYEGETFFVSVNFSYMTKHYGKPATNIWSSDLDLMNKFRALEEVAIIEREMAIIREHVYADTIARRLKYPQPEWFK